MSERAPSPESSPPGGTSTAPAAAPAPPPVAAHDDVPAPGRRVVLAATPPGFRRIMLGAVIAVLAPFFGILIGSGIGEGDSFSGMQPMYWGFFTGGLIGGAALLVAASGARALWRSSRAREREE